MMIRLVFMATMFVFMMLVFAFVMLVFAFVMPAFVFMMTIKLVVFCSYYDIFRRYNVSRSFFTCSHFIAIDVYPTSIILIHCQRI